MAADAAPSRRRRGPTGGSTRDDLLRAGRALADDLPLDRLYAGVTTAAVASAAGVTTGSFFHHFPNAARFADAMVRSFRSDVPDFDEVIDDLLDGMEHQTLPAVLSQSLAEAWHVVSRDEAIRADFRGQMQLLAHHRVPLEDPDDDVAVVGDVLRANFRAVIDGGTAGWERTLAATGRRVVAPLDERRLATAIEALVTGLKAIHAVDPDAVDDDLFADVATALTNAVTRTDLRSPRIVMSGTLGQEAVDRLASPQARSGARRRDENRRRIVEATIGMFDDGWDHVSATDVAEAADVSVQTVINLFGQVRRVAAATFGRHLPAFEAAIEAEMPDRPEAALRAALTLLARAAADDPQPARALLTERLGVRATRDFELSDDDIRMLVPFGVRLTFVVGILTDRPNSDPRVPDLAAMLIDSVLVHAIARPRHAEETVDLVLRLLPETPEPGTRPSGPGDGPPDESGSAEPQG